MDNKEIVGYIPRLLYKVYLFLKNKFDHPKPISEEQIICFEICKKLIPLKDTKITSAPLSNKRYLKNDSLKMFVVIENRMASIINDSYRYDVYFEEDKYYFEIIHLIDKEQERKRVELEEEIKSNIEHSLKNILSNLDKHTSQNIFD